MIKICLMIAAIFYLRTVWPYLAKKITFLGNFLVSIKYSGKNWAYIGNKHMHLGKILLFFIVMAKYWNDNLTIRSHYLRAPWSMEMIGTEGVWPNERTKALYFYHWECFTSARANWWGSILSSLKQVTSLSLPGLVLQDCSFLLWSTIRRYLTSSFIR